MSGAKKKEKSILFKDKMMTVISLGKYIYKSVALKQSKEDRPRGYRKTSFPSKH